jgi:hypothetical protein
MSVRDQDWVVKIDYNNGAGTGNILWRLGLAGDFTLGNSVGNPYPWFSAQHDAGFATPAGMDPEQIFTVFDNGVSRHARYGGDSRGQVWTIDQTHMIATLTVNADLGAYSYSLGSAQMLVNGDYSFVAGNIASGKTVVGQNTEVAPPFPSGTDVYQFQGVGSVVYRGGRLVSFYNIQLNGAAGPE